MSSRHAINLLLFCAVLLASGEARTIEYDLRGQVSAYHLEARSDGDRSHGSGIRYIPLLELTQDIDGDTFLDLEVSLNAWAATGCGIDDNRDIELYRLKLRFATPRTETRLGLQTINFGPGYLLRPLRWFDRLDPRDPLRLTDGIYALRFKYVAPNNANIWLWGLYGNDEQKGYEFMQTSDDRPEFGGRLQFPMGPGELALTVHNRKVDPRLPDTPTFGESRFAVDGRWDVHVGFWFEAVLQQQASIAISTAWTKTVMLGTDYTLGIGNGLHVLFEHMTSRVTTNEPMLDPGLDKDVSAIMLGYPVGYLDYIQAIGYYDWESDDYYQFVSWQRSWDNLAINISLFRNPNRIDRGLQTAAAGTGGQILLMYNH